MARVVPMDSYGEKQQEFIRNGSNYQTFHLPATEDTFEESLVDFRFVIALDPAWMESLRRIGSLTKEGRDSLRHQLILYWTRTEPKAEAIQTTIPGL